MTQDLLRGVIAPNVTVFHDDERLDEKGTAQHVRWLIDQGVDAVVPCGSSGEFPALTAEETRRLIEVAVAAADGRVPVLPATGRYSTRETIELSRHAEACGARGVMVVLPYYMLPDPRSVLQHFRDVRREIGLPIILYNNPWTCGIELPANLVGELVSDGTVQAVKASHGDPFRVAELKHVCGDRLSALYGHDFAPLEAFLAGADGWLTGVINVFPRQAKELWQAAAIDKDVDAARAIWRRLMPFVMHERSPGAAHLVSLYKGALAARGRAVGRPRRPLRPLDPEQQQRVAALVHFADAGDAR